MNFIHAVLMAGWLDDRRAAGESLNKRTREIDLIRDASMIVCCPHNTTNSPAYSFQTSKDSRYHARDRSPMVDQKKEQSDGEVAVHGFDEAADLIDGKVIMMTCFLYFRYELYFHIQIPRCCAQHCI